MPLIYEFGKRERHKYGQPRPNGFPKICPQVKTLKTLTPGDLENEVVTPKS